MRRENMGNTLSSSERVGAALYQGREGREVEHDSCVKILWFRFLYWSLGGNMAAEVDVTRTRGCVRVSISTVATLSGFHFIRMRTETRQSSVTRQTSSLLSGLLPSSQNRSFTAWDCSVFYCYRCRFIGLGIFSFSFIEARSSVIII